MATSSLAIGQSIDSCNLIKIGKTNNVMSRNGKGWRKNGLKRRTLQERMMEQIDFLCFLFEETYIWIS